MKILIDTNVIISAILFPGSKTACVFNHILECHEPVICSFSVKETYTVFKRKFPDRIHSLDCFYNEIDCEFFTTPEIIQKSAFPEIRDEHDLPILASAILSDADVLLTGDKDFEEIQIRRPLIMSPSRYFELL